MPRVKRGVTAHARHKKVLDQAKGYYGARSKVYPGRQAGRHQGRSIRLSRPSPEEARIPGAVDRSHQRRRP
jgi:ribosomal protein L20